MKKVNDLFNKRVINQATGNPIDSVRDVVLSDDGRRIVALVVGGGSRSHDEQIIRWDSIISVGEYVIVDGRTPFATVDEDMEVADLRKQAYQITGKPVISASGERIGTIGDMFFNDHGEVVGYEIKQGGMFSGAGDSSLLPAEHIQAIGKDAIIATSAELMPIKDDEPLAEEDRARMVGEPREPQADMPPAPREPQADVPLEPDEPLAGEPLEPDEPLADMPPTPRERRNIDPDQDFRSL